MLLAMLAGYSAFVGEESSDLALFILSGRLGGPLAATAAHDAFNTSATVVYGYELGFSPVAVLVANVELA